MRALALLLFLILIAVSAWLVAGARRRARVADARVADADARRRESLLFATVASSLLEDAQAWSPPSAPEAAARLELASAPSPGPAEIAIRVPTREETCWLYVDRERWAKEDAKRIAAPLADVIDLELNRRRLAETAADVEAARRADGAKTALLNAVSNDLRPPLTAITSAAAALNSGVIEDGDRSHLLSVLESEAARLERLIGDLVTLSRIEAGSERPDAEQVDLREVVAAAVEHVRALHREGPIEIDLPEDLPPIRADPVQIQRVFANLIENAVKLSPPGKPVSVTGGGGGRVVVTVTGSGRAIPPSQRAHVFDPFFRAGDGGAGWGLGLAVSRGFVEANGGKIALRAHGGPGTAFTVSFPAVRPAEVG
jgi:two-component system sensor histidine kinase KdpD